MQRRSRVRENNSLEDISRSRNAGSKPKVDDSKKQKSTFMNVLLGALVIMIIVVLIESESNYNAVPVAPTKTATNPRLKKPETITEPVETMLEDTEKETRSLPEKEDTLTEKESTKYDKPPLLDVDGSKLHIIFSTDCSAYQHWQSYMLFFSALQVQQPGYVTRIASGCSDEEQEKEQKWHDEHIGAFMSDRFQVHFTPHFSTVKKEDGSKGDYKYFNKPFGLRDWMENGEGMGIDHDTNTPVDEDVIVILIDPDQALLRPIRADFSDETETITKEKDYEKYPLKVSHGHPIAQKYGLGAQWRKFNLEKITGSADSPAIKVTSDDGFKHYPAGPPYLATARDFYQISLKWTEFAPGVHEEYPYLLAEMFAYCIAAAHLELPHRMVESLMVSNSGAGGEGWPFVDSMEGNVCDYDYMSEDRTPAPNVIHYCQRHIVDRYFFGKRRVPTDYFTCESPLLVKPPIDLGEAYDYKYPVGLERKRKGLVSSPLTHKEAKRDAFMICTMTKAMNRAGEFFKANHCPGTELEYTLDLGALAIP